METKQINLVDKIMNYESGSMSNIDTINFFQYLIDTGICWTLQGHYGRQANYFIEQGICIINHS